MKKRILILLTLVSLLCLSSCGKHKVKFTIENANIEIAVGEKFEVSPKIEGTDCGFNLSTNSDIIEINGAIITAKKSGEAEVIVSLKEKFKGVEDIKVFVKVLKPTLLIEKIDDLFIGDEAIINVGGLEVDDKVELSTSDIEIATIENDKLIAKKEGTVSVIARSGEREATISVTIKKPVATNVKIESVDQTLKVGEKFEIKYVIEPVKYSFEANITSSDPNVAEVDGNNIVAKGLGKCTISVTVDDVKDEICVEVIKPDLMSITLTNSSLDIKVGQTHKIEYTLQPSEYEYDVKFESLDTTILTVDADGTIKALKAGTTSIKIYCGEVSSILEVNVVKPDLESIIISKKDVKVIIGETFKIDYELEPAGYDYEVLFKVTDDTIASVTKDGTVKGLKLGKTSINVYCGEISSSLEVSVINPDLKSIDLTQNATELLVGGTFKIDYKLDPVGYDYEVLFKVADSNIAKVEKDGTIKALSIGETVITVYCGTVVASFNLSVYKDEVNPVFNYQDGYSSKVRLNWNQTFNPCEGLIATDDHDGDISSLIKVTKNDVDNQKYGKYKVTYEVQDKAGNVATLEREVEVVWDYGVTFIGHAGSYYGLMNSEEAIRYALEVLHYQAIECDIKQTKDGVFILCHDNEFGGYSLSSTEWSVLKDVERTASRNAGIPSKNGSVVKQQYTTKLCTLGTYLDLCKQYGAKAVIELKSSAGISNNDTSRMGALMKEIAEHDMLNDVIFLGSQYKCLIWTRENGYNYIPCQYLVNSCESNDVLNRCLEYDFEVSINVTGNYSNSDAWLQKYKDAGIKISTYTYTQYVDYPVVQKWIDKGVDYVTCDWHRMEQLRLPPKKDESQIVKHEVKFIDYDGTVLREMKVLNGKSAIAPTVPERAGYKFVGWDVEFSNITAPTVVKAVYENAVYKITYMLNNSSLNEQSWPTKEDFKNDFYNDLFAWIKANYSRFDKMSFENGVYTIECTNKSYSNLQITSVTDLMDANVYVFEGSIAKFIYKPIETENSKDYIPVVDNDYFLNTEPYRTKYLNLNAYLLAVMNTSYSGYSKLYKQTSNGRVQIFFRFHQWFNGTKIAAFDKYPTYYISEVISDMNEVMPTEHLTYTYDDSFDLPVATSKYEFLGWYLDMACTKPLTRIEKGSIGDLTLFAKWKFN